MIIRGSSTIVSILVQIKDDAFISRRSVCPIIAHLPAQEMRESQLYTGVNKISRSIGVVDRHEQAHSPLRPARQKQVSPLFTPHDASFRRT